MIIKINEEERRLIEACMYNEKEYYENAEYGNNEEIILLIKGILKKIDIKNKK